MSTPDLPLRQTQGHWHARAAAAGQPLHRVLQEHMRPAPPAAPYMLWQDLRPAYARPRAFQSLRTLAAAIHALRADREIALAPRPDELFVQGRTEPCEVTAITYGDGFGGPGGFLGWACLNGRPWQALQAELYRLQPRQGTRVEQVFA